LAGGSYGSGQKSLMATISPASSRVKKLMPVICSPSSRNSIQLTPS
jgi:hypothetical protein